MNAVLVIKPGPLRDGLDALLFSMPDVQLVAHANDNNTVLDFCQKNPDALLILEIRPDSQDLLATISEVKVRCPQGRVVALIHTQRDQRDAEEAGADLILRVGTRAPMLKTSIEGLIRTTDETSQ